MVITRTTRNRLIRKGPWVRIPPSPPHRSKRYKACSDFSLKIEARPQRRSSFSAKGRLRTVCPAARVLCDEIHPEVGEPLRTVCPAARVLWVQAPRDGLGSPVQPQTFSPRHAASFVQAAPRWPWPTGPAASVLPSARSIFCAGRSAASAAACGRERAGKGNKNKGRPAAALLH